MIVIPLYGFLEGDTIGLLVLANEGDTMMQLLEKLAQAASVRVQPRAGLTVEVAGRKQLPSLTVRGVGLQPLDRFDVRVGDGV
jgi:hypothetical protein